MPLSNKRIKTGYTVAFILLGVAYWLVFLIIGQLKKDAENVRQSNLVIHELERVRYGIVKAETSLRGFTLSRDTVFLRNYEDAIQIPLSIITKLEEQKAGDHAFIRELNRLANFVHIRMEVMKVYRGQIVNQIFSNDTLNMMVRKNKPYTDSIDSQTDQLQRQQTATVNIQSEELDRTFALALFMTIISLFLTLAAVVLSVFVYNNEKKQREAAVQRSQQYGLELEERVNELFQVNRELEELKSEEKFATTGRLASTIAHEVRNPLTNITLAAGQLKDHMPVNEDTELLHDMIVRNSKRINQLVSELLHSTRFSQLDFSNMDINELIESTLLLANDRIELNGIKVIKEFGPNTCEVRVDKEKVQLALLNIIVNAIEAMEPHKGVLKIKTAKEGKRCLIDITDNGSGMSEETQQKIFDPFFTSKQSGNGLGMTNAQNVILNHKGSMQVYSKIDQGTTIRIHLNLHEISTIS